MAKTKHVRRMIFLKSICSDSGVCLSFGTEANKIKQHFNNFVNFDYVKSITPIGRVSANGFIRDVQYEHRGYIANAILKSSTRESSDNLLYEYMVGVALNSYHNRYPCFVETYGCYNYNAENDWVDMQVSPTVDILKNKLKLIKHDSVGVDAFAKKACDKPKLISVLIQHFKGVRTLREMMAHDSFIETELLNILSQVYIPLYMLKDNFTHYDLHSENVLLYEPVVGKYIHYHYHLSNKLSVDFKSKYIAKIIDYGRSYFYHSDNLNSAKLYKNVCDEKSCTQTCGDQKGFWAFGDSKQLPYTYWWITSKKRNMSHDLRLLFNINYQYTASFKRRKNGQLTAKDNIFTDISNNIVYRDPNGTPELNDSRDYKLKINNVADAAKYIMSSMLKIKRLPHLYVDAYSDPSNKIGDLHIYLDGRPMNFIKVPPPP